jgi:hypothetical protein
MVLKLTGIFVILLISGCSVDQYLTGNFNQNEFDKACKWQTKIKSPDKADMLWIDSLRTIKDTFGLTVFLGTWCSDSKKLVPKMFGLLPFIPVKLERIYALDTTKNDSAKFAQANSISRIPVFIFKRNGVEMARISEKPEKRLSRQLYYLLKY